MHTSEIHRSLAELFKKSSIALALARADEDRQLVLINDHFSQLTGYDSHDVVGKNCRFLQTSPDGYTAANNEAKTKIHAFLQADGPVSVRTPIVNFRKDAMPFVNLLFMSKLRDSYGKDCFIIASQFDVSRAHADLLQAYDDQLGDTLTRLRPLLDDHNVIIEGTLATIANSTSTIAQAKLRLAELETNSPYVQNKMMSG